MPHEGRGLKGEAHGTRRKIAAVKKRNIETNRTMKMSTEREVVGGGGAGFQAEDRRVSSGDGRES